MTLLNITNDRQGLKKFCRFGQLFPNYSITEAIEAFTIESKPITKPIRQPFNLRIVDLLKEIIENNPDLRFTQILSILELDKDKFYEEPHITLTNMEMKIKENKLCIFS